MSGSCAACDARLYFHERVVWPSELCRRCAWQRGIVRVADHLVVRNIASEAAQREPWWGWTVWLFWSIATDDKSAWDRYCDQRRERVGAPVD